MGIATIKIKNLKKNSPLVKEFLENYGIRVNNDELSVIQVLESFNEDFFEDIGIDQLQLIQNLEIFIKNTENIATGNNKTIESITLVGGKNKQGLPENIEIILKPGTITSIVGPTGSGKSRLLADIEWMAQGDTPTGRKILINNNTPDTSFRFLPEHKLVAQLSQNMNFVMDTTAADFIAMHAESRMIANSGQLVNEIITQANLLAGEQFTSDTPVTALSGGQSRALMIADTAFLSSSPIVLIDEIENAGIDRKKALSLLVKNDKIVLMATHDPILALMAPRRLVIKNGGILKIIETTEAEKKNLEALEKLDNQIQQLRNRLRNGETIEYI
jgi:ABC-type lipoprotein export system ATPase subunit